MVRENTRSPFGWRSGLLLIMIAAVTACSTKQKPCREIRETLDAAFSAMAAGFDAVTADNASQSLNTAAARLVGVSSQLDSYRGSDRALDDSLTELSQSLRQTSASMKDAAQFIQKTSVTAKPEQNLLKQTIAFSQTITNVCKVVTGPDVARCTQFNELATMNESDSFQQKRQKVESTSQIVFSNDALTVATEQWRKSVTEWLTLSENLAELDMKIAAIRKSISQATPAANKIDAMCPPK